MVPFSETSAGVPPCSIFHGAIFRNFCRSQKESGCVRTWSLLEMKKTSERQFKSWFSRCQRPRKGCKYKMRVITLLDHVQYYLMVCTFHEMAIWHRLDSWRCCSNAALLQCFCSAACAAPFGSPVLAQQLETGTLNSTCCHRVTVDSGKSA